MKTTTISLSIAVLLILLAAFVIFPGILHSDDDYAGQLTFTSQEDFEAFKDDFKSRIVSQGLKLDKFSVLSSDPPIIVTFKVSSVPYNYNFPYGKVLLGPVHDVILATLLSILVSGGIFVVVVVRLLGL